MTRPVPQPVKGEATFALILFGVGGFVVLCVLIITFGMMKFGAQKEIECRCPDGSILKEITSAAFEPERVCPALCESRRSAALPPAKPTH